MQKVLSLVYWALLAGISSGAVFRPSPGSLQDALDKMRPGDVVELQPGGIYRGGFTIRASGGGLVTTAGWTRRKTRVAPQDADGMAKVIAAGSRNQRAFVFEDNASKYTFRGIEIEGDNLDPIRQQTVLMLMNPSPDISRSCDQIVIEECYIHGTGRGRVREGIRFNATNSIIRWCHFEDFTHPTEAYAINLYSADNCAIYDNHLEANGIPVFLGVGGEMAKVGPSRILIHGNTIRAAIQYKGVWGCKHAIELKGGQYIMITGNKFYDVYRGRGVGDTSVIYPKTNYSPVNDIYIRGNETYNCEGYFLQLVSQNVGDESPVTRNITAIDNRHRAAPYGRNRLVRITNESQPLTNVFLSNLYGEATVTPSADMVLNGTIPAAKNLNYHGVKWNIKSRYGIKGDGTEMGTASLQRYVDGYLSSSLPAVESHCPPPPVIPILEHLDLGPSLYSVDAVVQ